MHLPPPAVKSLLPPVAHGKYVTSLSPRKIKIPESQFLTPPHDNGGIQTLAFCDTAVGGILELWHVG